MSKNKKKQEDKRVDHKTRGNGYFQDKNYEEAIREYTLAIVEDPNNHVLYSNRSASFSLLGKYDEAILDAEMCIEKNTSWAKGYYRKGVALEGLVRYEEAMESYKTGLIYEKDDPSLLKAITDIADILSTVSLTNSQVNPESDVFNIMLKWLIDGGAKFPKLFLQYYDEDYRGVHSLANIKTNEVILSVPRNLIMTSEVAKASTIGMQIVAAESRGLELRSKHSYLASYLLLQKSIGAASEWKPYMDTLPSKYRNMPIFFTSDELKWLKGSMCVDKIQERKESLRIEYDNICRYVPSFAEYKYEEFVWARLVVITRIFGIVVDQQKTDGLVPMADMLNHKRPRETKWTFDEEMGAFTITALTNMNRGDQIFDSYGQKCNSRFFVNYGFALDENELDNEVIMRFELPRNDPHFSMKLRLLNNPKSLFKDFQIPTNYKEKKTKEAFSFLRFSFAKDAELMLLSAENFRIDDIDQISLNNEILVLNALKAAAEFQLLQFDCSMEEDNKILLENEKAKCLTSNERNCVVVRRGEKQVLHYYVDLANVCLPLMSLSWGQFKKAAGKLDDIRFEYYMTIVVVPLMKRYAANSK